MNQRGSVTSGITVQVVKIRPRRASMHVAQVTSVTKAAITRPGVHQEITNPTGDKEIVISAHLDPTVKLSVSITVFTLRYYLLSMLLCTSYKVIDPSTANHIIMVSLKNMLNHIHLYCEGDK